MDAFDQVELAENLRERLELERRFWRARDSLVREMRSGDEPTASIACELSLVVTEWAAVERRARRLVPGLAPGIWDARAVDAYGRFARGEIRWQQLLAEEAWRREVN